MRGSFLIIFLFYCGFIWGQNHIKIDSLQIKLDNAVEDTSRINLLIELSNEFYSTNLLQSEQNARLALDLSKKIKNNLFVMRSEMALGRSLISMGNYDDALAIYFSTLKLAQKNKLPTDEIIIYTRMGIIQDRIGQFDSALGYYFDALNIYNVAVESGVALEERANIQGLYNNIGNIYESKDELEKAEEYYLKGLALAENKNDERNIGIICNNLGNLELQKQEYQKSLEFLLKSLDARQKINDKSGIAKSYYHLSLYYQKLLEFEKALEFAQKALEISQEVNEPLSEQVSAMLMYQIYKEQGKFEEALRFHELYKQLNDSLINDSKISEITRLQLKFDYEKEEIEKEEAHQKSVYTVIIIISVLILGLIILALLFVLSKSRHKRMRLENDQLERDMAVKNKELTTNVIYLMKKNELIISITERLLDLKAQLKGENVTRLNRIILDLQSVSDKEVWTEFEYRFQNVHEEFYQKLKEKFPELSPSEIRLAAFLRLNMTSKEISSITGQSVNSLETARYRLRKKLGITNQEVNLVNFLLNI